MEHINPEGLLHNPAFSQVITTSGKGKNIYIGGQNAVNKDREIIGKGNLAEQTEQVMKNLETALKACKADFEHLVKLNIHILQGQNATEAFQVSQKYLGRAGNPPTITVTFISGFVHPDFLLEIDAIAFLPESV